jgi:Fe-S-cluster containining protein
VGLGPYIAVERKLGDRDFYCRNKITGEIFLAHIQPEYAREFEEDVGTVQGTAKQGKGCLFMVKNRDGTGSGCAIYPTRPAVCREFRCYHMLIYDAKGELRGTVIGRNVIKTTDESLARIWKDRVVPLPCGSQAPLTDLIWTKKVLGILAESGYRGDPVR